MNAELLNDLALWFWHTLKVGIVLLLIGFIIWTILLKRKLRSMKTHPDVQKLIDAVNNFHDIPNEKATTTAEAVNILNRETGVSATKLYVAYACIPSLETKVKKDIKTNNLRVTRFHHIYPYLDVFLREIELRETLNSNALIGFQHQVSTAKGVNAAYAVANNDVRGVVAEMEDVARKAFKFGKDIGDMTNVSAQEA
ncbi:MAG: hypothetical protein DI585_03165 [Pseudomonas fluorescens]|nr:MAG: hypothetical protein DI585_03165 [Pseudomonas fluorescens]